MLYLLLIEDYLTLIVHFLNTKNYNSRIEKDELQNII